MGQPIDKITLRGFKSIRALEDFPLRNLNILIGANGAGKSNFVSFFTFLREAVGGRLGLHVAKKGGADDHLFMGPKVTEEVHARLHFAASGYEFTLQPTVNDTLVYADERILYDGDPARTSPVDRSIGSGHKESVLKEQLGEDRNKTVSGFIYGSISHRVVYHFHDTSDTAAMPRFCSVRDYEYLRPDGANLAVFLLFLHAKHLDVYDRIGISFTWRLPSFMISGWIPSPSMTI